MNTSSTCGEEAPTPLTGAMTREIVKQIDQAIATYSPPLD
jgi:hypothetical protein